MTWHCGIFSQRVRLPPWTCQLQSPTFLDVARRDSRHFTRQRDLTFPALIAFLLSGIRGAVQGELDTFFAVLARRIRLSRVITASAFSKARSHLRVKPKSIYFWENFA